MVEKEAKEAMAVKPVEARADLLEYVIPVVSGVTALCNAHGSLLSQHRMRATTADKPDIF